MSDKFTTEQRSAIMSKVRSFNTTPELKVRKLLHSLGFRFRLHRKDLPGCPDIVLPKYKTVVFVHGCFWHGCPTCKRSKIRPKNNSEYWNKKLDRNLQRDKENNTMLINLGWKVLIIWECETKTNNIPNLINKLNNEILSNL